MLRLLTLPLVCLFWCFFPASAQFYNQYPEFIQANRIWMFGMQAGITFGINNPASFTAPIVIGEGIAVASDPQTGNLLFFSDGRVVRDQSYTLMPNGNNILGNNGSSSQGACIIPHPGDPDKYFLFSLEDANGNGQLYYSVVDMSLNGGFGDIPAGQKNIRLDSNLSEAMIAVPGNNCDIWLLVHTRTDPVFKAYRITAAGLNTQPVISDTGPWPRSGRRTSGGQSYDAFDYCMMQISPDRNMIALSSVHPNPPAAPAGTPFLTGTLLCRFDPDNGTVADPLLLNQTATPNLSFSPDARLLYIAYPDFTDRVCSLYQYDITNYDSATISGSGIFIGNIPNPYNSNFQEARMRLYHDTIYIAGYLSETMHRINNPDQRGTGCGLQLNAILFQPGTAPIAGLPSDIVYTLEPDTVSVLQDTFICPGQTLQLHAPSRPPFRWDNDSAGTARQINAPGVYYVSGNTECHIRVDSFRVRFQPGDTSFAMLLDTLICHYHESLSVSAPDSYPVYRWSTGDTSRTIRPASYGTFWVLSDSFCTSRIDTVRIRGTDLRFSLGRDTSLCAGDILPLAVPIPGQYQWQDGSTQQSFQATEPGRYYVSVASPECSWSDTILITPLNAPQSLGADLSFCMDAVIEVILEAYTPPGAVALWNDGSVGNILTVNDTGVYWVQVCMETDTIRISKEICTCDPFLPDAFTPNGDGINDQFRLLTPTGCDIRFLHMEIYNRWGTLVFSTRQPGHGWDGLHNGKPAEPGTYMYSILAETGTQGAKKLYQGDVLLIK